MDAGSSALVSVVMPAYNAESTIRQSMQSALAQSHAQIELVVVDDRSTDSTRSIITAIAAEDARVVPILLEVNAGVAAARNAGIEAARGDYIAFLDSDDLWRREKLEIQLAAMRQSGARIAYSCYTRIDATGKQLSIVNPPPAVDYTAMLKSNRIGNLTGIYDRSLGDARFRRIGHEDYAFWLEMVRRAGHAVRAGRSDEPLADYLVRPGSLSSDKLKAARWQWKIYREVEQIGAIRSCWYFANYVKNAAMKRQ